MKQAKETTILCRGKKLQAKFTFTFDEWCGEEATEKELKKELKLVKADLLETLKRHNLGMRDGLLKIVEIN